MLKHSRILFYFVLALQLILLGACNRPGASILETPEESEEKTLQITVWNEHHEIFLEHKPIVAGYPTTMVTHVTNLRTLEPRREGPITFVLRQGTGPPIEQLVPNPARAGIYTPEVVFPQTGTWSVSIQIPEKDLPSLVILPSFQVHTSREEAAQAPTAEISEGVTFLKEQQWRVKIRSEPVTKRRMVERLLLSGVVRPHPGNKAAVTPPVSGRLLALPDKPFPSLGDRIEAGQALALIQPPFWDLGAKLLEAEAKEAQAKLTLEQAQQALERTQNLFQGKAKSMRELQEAEFNVRMARAKLEEAASMNSTYKKMKAIAPLELPALELKAPISGAITHVGASWGEFVSPDRAAFTILNTETVYIEARIPESDLGRMDPAHGASYETPHDPGHFTPILSGGGRLVLLGAEIDPRMRTASLIYEVKNPQGRLRLGMALRIHLETTQVAEALAIPDLAVVDADGRPSAYVHVSGETFIKRDLTLGIRDSGFVQVVAGLSEGERVVTEGSYTVRLASVAGTIPAHGHAH